jgi:Flp pilus assembly protein TadD
VRVWNLAKGAALHTLSGHDVPVVAVAVSADGQRAVSVTNDARIRVWDLEQGVTLKIMRDDLPAQTVAFARVRQIAIVTDSRSVRVWDLERASGWGAKIVDVVSSTVSGLSPGGQWAVFGSNDGKFIVWHLERDRGEREVLRVTYSNKVRAVAVTAQGRRAIFAPEDGTIRVWDTKQRTELHTLTGHSAPVVALAATSDSRLLVSASQDGVLKVWNLERGELIKSFSEDGRFCSCAIAADGGTILADDDLGRIYTPQFEGDRELDVLVLQAARTDEVDAPARADDLRSKGEKLSASGEHEAALDFFDRGLELQPDDLNLLSLRVSALLKLGRDQEALGSIDYALEKDLAADHDLGYMYAAKGHVLAGMGEHGSALSYYRKSLDIVTDDSKTWYMQGYVLHELEKDEAALGSLKHAMEIEGNEDTHLLISYCFLSMEEYSKAEQEFRSMLESGSSNPLVYHGLGLILIQLEEIDEGCLWLQRFLDSAETGHDHLVTQVKQILDEFCS